MAFSLHYAITQDLKHSQRPIPEPGYSILIIFCYNPVRGFSKDSVRRTRPLPNGIDFVRTRGVQRRMRRGPVAGVAGGGRGEAFVLSPSHLSHLHCQPTPLSHKDSPPFCSALRHPVSKGWGVFSAFYPYLLEALPLHGFLRYPLVKGWGIYGNFLPYLPEALPLYGPLRHPVSKGMGVFRDFYPYLLDCTRPLRHSLSAFKSSPFAHQADLPYTTAPFSVRNGLASASRTERGRFSVPHMPKSGSRTAGGPFSVPDGESPQGYRVLRLRRFNLNTNMPIESNFRARL